MRYLLTLTAALVCCGVACSASLHAQAVPGTNPLASACGTDDAKFNPKQESKSTPVISPTADKALVYVIELMPKIPTLTTHVRVGMDGKWIAQLSAQTYTAFLVDPGVHHLCTRYEGKAVPSEIGSSILHRLDAESGKTYYLLYRGFLSQSSGEIGFLDLVDEDEGQYALQTAGHPTASTVQDTAQ